MKRGPAGTPAATNADLFFGDLTGTPIRASRRRVFTRRTSAVIEPFFGDRPGDSWSVVAAAGSAVRTDALRPDDVVVWRRRSGGWRCAAVADADPRMLHRWDGRLAPNTLILRRRDTRGTSVVSLPEAELTIGFAEQAPAPACPLPKGSAIAYFFNAARYVRYNVAADAVDVGAAAMSTVWHLPPAFQSNLDAAVNWGDGHAYFFKGPNYVRYNIATDRVDVGPAAIGSNWPALPTDFQSGLGAVVNWGDGHAYFFKGPNYLRYVIATNVVDVGPVAISRYWTSLPADFQSNLDSVVNWGNGHVYFFKGPNYIRYVIKSETVDVGPVPIARHWPTLSAAFPSGVKAGVNWTYPGDLAELMRAAGVTVNESAGWRTRVSSGEHSCFTPVGIIMHHTASTNGANTLADIVTNVKANF
ncbi:MAG: hemopexin repeat-containing protein, partial [Acidobacteriota bacterium]